MEPSQPSEKDKVSSEASEDEWEALNFDVQVDRANLACPRISFCRDTVLHIYILTTLITSTTWQVPQWSLRELVVLEPAIVRGAISDLQNKLGQAMQVNFESAPCTASTDMFQGSSQIF